MSKIFLSHSSAQKYLVENLAEKIGRDRVVYDNFSFEAGMDSLDEIVRTLGTTDLFVLLLSEEALNSDWVKAELKNAHRLLQLGSIKQFLPLIIDPKINYHDKRIPEWIKQRNLKCITESFLIVKKIDQSYRDILIDTNPTLKARENIFVGRNTIMEEFESTVLTTSPIRPVSFICSGVEGVGRRTFMRKALAKTDYITEYYEPVSIYLDAKESIEDFIIKIEDVNGSLSDEILRLIRAKSFKEKIEHAISLVKKLIDNNEKLFIIDSGCIIQPNKRIVDWFLKIVADSRLDNTLAIILITRFRPNPSFVLSNTRFKSLHISSLSKKDLEKLFVKYQNLMQLHINQEDSNKILDTLNGIPSQVFFSIDLIKSTNINYVLKNLKEVVDYGESKVFYLIDEIQKDPVRLEILTLLAKVDFISFELLYKIIDRTPENEQILEEFFLHGVYDTLGGFADHIRVDYSISDYIKRSRFSIAPKYKKRIQKLFKDFMSEEKSHIDASELLLSVKQALIEGHKISDQYFLPSFVLKSIVELYYQRKYERVMQLADKILENKSNIGVDIEREIRYWLCLALAREKNTRFETEVQHIDGADYDFLNGFYYRKKREYDRALVYLRKALDMSPNFNRAKRELVSVLLGKGMYSEALDVAKQNYTNAKTNAFHIQAYFMSLIRKVGLTREDRDTLKELLNSIVKTNDRKSEEILITMQGEYYYYVDRDIKKSMDILTQSLQSSEFKYYPYKALQEIYMKQGMYPQAQELKARYENLELENDGSFNL